MHQNTFLQSYQDLFFGLSSNAIFTFMSVQYALSSHGFCSIHQVKERQLKAHLQYTLIKMIELKIHAEPGIFWTISPWYCWVDLNQLGLPLWLRIKCTGGSDSGLNTKRLRRLQFQIQIRIPSVGLWLDPTFIAEMVIAKVRLIFSDLSGVL